MKRAAEVVTKPEMQEIINNSEQDFDLIIIGGGPAGLTAATYAGRAGLRCALIEKALLGGQVITTFIENYPGFPQKTPGPELIEKFEEQARLYGTKIIYGDVVSLENHDNYKIVIAGEKKHKTRAIIIASGTEPKKLEVKGEKEFMGRGVSYCATCDGPFYKDKHIAVIGGGNSAIEEAIFLTKYAKKVSIIHRRDKLRADTILTERALQNSKIFVLWHTIIEEIIGKKRVEEIVLKDVQTNKKRIMEADGVFIYVGSLPKTSFVKDLLDLDEVGFIKTDEELKTNVPGIFAAGDVRSKSFRQIITAAADGALAVNSARLYLENQ